MQLFEHFVKKLYFCYSINYEGGTRLLEAVYHLMKFEEYRNLIDFDNHLDNISLDWRNLNLNDAIDDAFKNH